ncbi:right-handed parallel beta-helix repeat-containing protein, partial [bacterium]|nr:right-handed parallel beta-helix repeat-containing protein [bacterium]
MPSNVIAGNGIQLSYGATGTTSGNVVHGVGYTGDTWSATGILLFESGDISMDGDLVHACESGINYSNWGWIYSHPSVVDLSFADVVLYDNEWALSAQLSADNADLTFAADGCVILDSTGDGIDLYGTDAWGTYYTGWDNGDLVADITDCVITGTTLDGIWVDDYSGNSTNTMDIEVHHTAIESNVNSGLWNSSSYLIDAEDCWWGDPAGPTVLPPGRDTRPAMPPVSPFGDELPEQGEVRYAESGNSRARNGVYGPVDYSPWLLANIVCVPDPESLTATDPVKTIDVDYLGGGGGLMYGYTVKVRWDGSIVSTAPVKVTEGTLLSDEGTTFFYPRTTGTDEITVDCLLLGAIDGATGPGTMFSVEFTGAALGTSDVGIIVDRVRDKDNNTLTGFVADYGLLIVDLTIPTVTTVLITNDEPDVSDLYVKNGDQVTITANVSDDDPAFGLANIKADLSDLGGASDANPDTYADPVATWTLSSVSCTPADDEHVVTVTVTATDPIGNTANANDTIIADNVAPTVVTVFDASPAHEECSLTWANGTDTYYEGTVIQRADVSGEYPQYPWLVGNWPTVDTAYPGSELLGTNVYNGSGTGYTDGVVARNIYYYQAFSYDGARNYSAADAGARDLATNYWLGDVSDVWGSWGYDGEVDADDILKLSDSYGLSSPTGNEAECDVGPTVHPDWHRLGLPLPDDEVEFEDAMIFAMNYGVVAAKVVPFLPEEHSTDVLALTLSEREMVGSEVEIALRLEGNVGDVKGVSAAVAYDANELEFVSARLSDDMSLPLADVFFWSGTEEGRVLVDALVLGTDVT